MGGKATLWALQALTAMKSDVRGDHVINGGKYRVKTEFSLCGSAKYCVVTSSMQHVRCC